MHRKDGRTSTVRPSRRKDSLGPDTILTGKLILPREAEAMPHPSLQAVVREIRHLATVPKAKDRTDGDLLRTFLSDNDQPAFTELVRRHAPMVLSVCRRVLYNAQDAEDAFQAAFLLLARQAASIRQTESLAGWLHGVAYRMATNARRAASRRRRHETQSTAVSPPNPAWTVAWREVQAVLDEEIQRLPEVYRQPFVLCCLENRSCAETARQLGLKEGTVWSRVARARQKLQVRLTKRGVALTAVLGAAALSGNTALSAVPPSLISSSIQAATHVAAAPTTVSGLVSPNVAALVEGGNRGMVLTKGKTLMLLLLTALGVGVAGASVLAQREGPPTPAKPRQETAPPNRPKEPPVGRTGAVALRPQAPLGESGDTVTVAGRVLDPEGRSFAGAKLLLWLDYNVEKAIPPKVRATSGPDGSFRITFAKHDILDIEEPWINARAEPWRWAKIIAAARGYGCGWADLGLQEKRELTLRLVQDDVPIKGRVLDLQGRPIAGAHVWLKNIESWYRPSWEGLSGELTTNQDGRFTLTGVGRERHVTLGIAGPSIELKSVELAAKPPAGGKPADGVYVEVVVGPSKPIEGTVRARDTGKPLAGVEVFSVPGTSNGAVYEYQGPRTVTDRDGRYRLLGLPKAGQYNVLVRPKPGQPYLTSSKLVADSEGLKPLTLNFDLRRGVPVRFRLIDKETCRVVRGSVQYTPAKTNPLWAEAVAPYRPGLILPPRVWFDSHTSDRDGFIQFVAYPGHGAIFASAGWGCPPYLKARLDPEDVKKGYYPLGKGDPNNGFVDIVDGYRVVDTDRVDRPLTFDIELTHGRALTGTLSGPDAKPVTGAGAYGLTFDASASRPDMLRETPLAQQVLKTDAFTALGLYTREPRTLSFVHKDRKLVGYVVVHGTETGPLTVRLEPCGALTGRLVDAQGQPLKGVRLRLHYPELPRPGFLYQDLEFPTDEQGRFRVEWLLPARPHGLSVVADAKLRITLAAPEKLKNLSVTAGEVKDLGDLWMK
jgi:RNA polymerase sigma factor (sigma-70 family)